MTTSDRSSAAGPSARPRDRRERMSGLYSRVMAGDRRAMDELVGELTPMLWRVARSTGLMMVERFQ